MYFTIIIQHTKDNNYIPAIFKYPTIDDAKAKAYSEIGYNYSAKVLKSCMVQVIDEFGSVLFTETYKGE